MRNASVPKRAIGALLLGFSACAAEAYPQPMAADKDACNRADVEIVAAVDPSAGSWRLLAPPHGQGGSGQPLTSDAVLDSCDALVSLAHDPGPGGKIYQPGPAQLLYSTDRRTWQPRDMSTQGFFRGLAHGAGAWVAVGERMGMGVISVSKQADASQWREVFQHSMYFRSVAYGAGKFVAATQAGVAISSDGEHWQWAELPAVRSLYFEVAYGASRFVLSGVGATLNSLDGEHWSESSCGAAGCPVIDTPSGPAMTAIALQEMRYAAGAFYGFGASGQLRSKDGVSFEVYKGEHVPDFALGGKLVSLVRMPGDPITQLAMSSDDGATWSVSPLAAASASADCAKYVCVATRSELLVFEPAP
jgi:hypothetical protein